MRQSVNRQEPRLAECGFFSSLRKAILLSCALLLMLGCTESSDEVTVDDDESLSRNACPILGLQTRIINGTECREGGSPIVQLSINLANGSQGLCSASLLTNQDLLTAAHCFFGIVLSATAEVGGETVGVDSIEIHPEVQIDPSSQAVFNDVAVVRLERPISGSTLPILVSRNVREGEIISIYGYGLDENGNSEVLRSGQMRVSGVSENHIFARFDGEGSNTCNGDSGGPAVRTFVNENNVLVDAIVGTVSSGELITCEAGDTTLFANILTDKVRDFITRTVPRVRVE